MVNSEHAVVVGGGHAAAGLVAALREHGWTGGITLVSAEDCLPYHRPPLSKAALCGEREVESLSIRPAAFYAERGIELRLGAAVTGIDRDACRLHLADGGELSYDALALATGARVRHLRLPGHELPGVCYLRDARDVAAIRERALAGRHAVIIGGGYIGLETAASLRKLGLHVTVLEAQSRVLQRVTAEEVSAFFSRVHQEEGVILRTEVGVRAFAGDTQVRAVELANGESLPADLVVVGVGVTAETALAEACGLAVDDGILVDEQARTSDPRIVAAGDCTNHPNALYGRRVRLESVQNANDQARVAAATLCGKQERYAALPWFWSDQYDVKLQIAGLSAGYDRVVLRGDSGSGRQFMAFYLQGERLLAVDAVNRPREFMAVRRALAGECRVDAARLADVSVPLAEVLA